MKRQRTVLFCRAQIFPIDIWNNKMKKLQYFIILWSLFLTLACWIYSLGILIRMDVAISLQVDAVYTQKQELKMHQSTFCSSRNYWSFLQGLSSSIYGTIQAARPARSQLLWYIFFITFLNFYSINYPFYILSYRNEGSN